MNIYLSGQDYWYEIQNVCRLFFPGTEILQTDTRDTADLICHLRRGTHCTHLSVVYRTQGGIKRAHTQVQNQTSRYRQDTQLAFGRLIFDLLHSQMGISPKWGILTGVRPVHLIERYLQSGMSQEQVRDLFLGDYRVTAQKFDLALQTGKVQQQCVKPAHPRDVSLYISIPFCPSRCLYCSFVSHNINRSHKLVAPYFDLLLQEIDATFDLIDSQQLALRTVYVGGGTPTTLTAPQLEALFEKLFSRISSPLQECTIEAGRPDTIDRQKLMSIAKYPVTRININPQTLNDEVLKNVGRLHTGQDVIDTFLLARQVGFENINMDLIAGLPGEDYASFCNSLDQVIALNPENVTVHTLSVKRSSTLRQSDAVSFQAHNTQVEAMQEYTASTLGAKGYLPYYLYRQKNTLSNLENVGFTKPGFEGLYNIYMMEEMHTILGCGAGSVTKLVHPNGVDIKRIYNFKYPGEYIQGFEEMIARKEGILDFYAKISKE